MESDGNAFADSAEGNCVSEQEARHELERILADSDFHCTERNRRFLRFVSEELFQRRENSVKAYSIAVDVFGRASSFDPATDPIVRIEATRLRAALTRYYELYGHDHAVRIDLPKGRYVPVFSRARQHGLSRTTALPETPAASVSGKTRSSRLYPGVRTRWVAATLGIAGGALVAAMLFAFDGTGAGTAPLVSRKPNLTIEMRLAGDAGDERAIAMRDALMVALSGFQSLRISAPDAVTASTGSKPVVPVDAVQSRYRLLLKYSDEGPALWWQIVDETTGEALRSGNEKLPDHPAAAAAPMEQLASQLAIRIASGRGAINTIEVALELDRPTLGNGCVLRAMLAIDSKEKVGLAKGRECLQQTLVLRENDPDAHAMLAGVLLKMDTPDLPTKLTDQALASANRAVVLAPDSDRSYAALMNAQFRAGNIEAAVLAGRQAVALNPYNPGVAARLARILFVTGRWEEGVALAQAALQYGALPNDAEVTLAFDAYRRAEYDEALTHLRQANASECYCLQLLEVATLGQLGRFDEASAAATALRRSRPQFETSFRADLARRQFAPSLVALLQAGLEKAGLKVA